MDDTEEAEEPTKNLRATRWQSLEPFVRNTTIAVSGALLLAGNAFAQAARLTLGERRKRLADGVHGPIAKGLALVAIVVGGLSFAFGEGGGNKTFAGIVFGLWPSWP